EEPELRCRRRQRQATAAQREEPPGARHVDTQAAQVRRETQDRRAARRHQTPCRERSYPRDTDEQILRRARHLEREVFGVRQRPRCLRIVVEREIAAGVERELLEAKAVVAQEMLRLVEAELAARRRRREAFHRRPDDRRERTEVRVMQEPLSLEPGDDAEDLAVTFSRRADDELRGGGADASLRGGCAPPVAKEATRILELRQEITAEILLAGEPPHVRVARSFEVQRGTIPESGLCVARPRF